MKQIIFLTPEPLDLRSITVFGLTSKPGSTDPIGRFGTGLKYAIATLLRHNHRVDIQSDSAHYAVKTEPSSMRGKPFEQCLLIQSENSVAPQLTTTLPFTTELGSHWELWMAMRELYSNTLDEGGVTFEWDDNNPLPHDSTFATSIIVTGEAFHRIFLHLDEYFRFDSPLEVLHDLEILDDQPSNFLFNRGIRVAQFELPTLFTYNIPSRLTLTEDRTLTSSYELDRRIISNILHSEDEHWIKSIVTAPSHYHESRLDFTYYQSQLGAQFLMVVNGVYAESPSLLNASLIKVRKAELERQRRAEKSSKRNFHLSLKIPEDSNFTSDDLRFYIERELARVLELEEEQLELILTENDE